ARRVARRAAGARQGRAWNDACADRVARGGSARDRDRPRTTKEVTTPRRADPSRSARLAFRLFALPPPLPLRRSPRHRRTAGPVPADTSVVGGRGVGELPVDRRPHPSLARKDGGETRAR